MPIVNPGPLPQDGEHVDSSAFIEAFVNGTTVGDIPSSAFNTDFSFVASQTDVPATKRGLLWFQRGAGRLWFFDTPDAGNSRYTATVPVCIAPTREILVQVSGPSRVGGVVGSRREVGVNLAQYYRDKNQRQTRIASVDDVETVATRLFQSRYLTQESAPSGYPCRAVEWGYCFGQMVSGVSSVPGSYLKSRGNDSTNTADWGCHSRFTAYSGETNYQGIGFILNSTGATNPYVNTVYKRATTDFYWGG